MALERSATGNDAALCPLPAPKAGEGVDGGPVREHFSRRPDPLSCLGGGHGLKPSFNQDCWDWSTVLLFANVRWGGGRVRVQMGTSKVPPHTRLFPRQAPL